MKNTFESPKQKNYDVVIVGGAIYGSATAWFLSDNPDFNGSVLVVERDPSYENSSTMHTNSCMRQQFSTELNVRVSQFAAEFVKNFRQFMGGGEDVPQLSIRNFGYMYMADNETFAQVLRESQKVQVSAGAATKIMTPDDIKRDYPFYNVDDIVLGSHNLVDEGYWDGTAVFDGWRRSARHRGVEFLANEVVAMSRNDAGSRVESVTLKTGEVIGCGQMVNASGPRAVLTSRMAGIDIPIAPWTFRYGKTMSGQLSRHAFRSLKPLRLPVNGRGIMPTTLSTTMRCSDRTAKLRISSS